MPARWKSGREVQVGQNRPFYTTRKFSNDKRMKVYYENLLRSNYVTFFSIFRGISVNIIAYKGAKIRLLVGGLKLDSYGYAMFSRHQVLKYGMPSVPKCDILFSTDITYFCGQILFNCCLFLLIQIQTFYSDTDISFGYRHFIRIQTFYSDTDISFGYRHFIRIQTFYSDTDISFGYRHFIQIQTFHSDTDILFG